MPSRFLLIAAVAVLAGAPATALAQECKQFGTIVALETTSDPVVTPHKIVYKTSILASEKFTVETDSDDKAVLAATLMTSQAEVLVTSDLPCPFDGGPAGNLVEISSGLPDE